jgi:hypothetical protein
MYLVGFRMLGLEDIVAAKNRGSFMNTNSLVAAFGILVF